MTPELLPCPFCGHVARLIHDTGADRERYWRWNVECTNLGECEAELVGFASAEAAASKWNSRKMTYTHRNGETIPPTSLGKYWFDGRATLWTGEIVLRQAIDCIERGGRILAWEERSQEHLPVAHFAGLWWGPVVPPWEQSA